MRRLLLALQCKRSLRMRWSQQLQSEANSRRQESDDEARDAGRLSLGPATRRGRAIPDPSESAVPSGSCVGIVLLANLHGVLAHDADLAGGAAGTRLESCAPRGRRKPCGMVIRDYLDEIAPELAKFWNIDLNPEPELGENLV